jgi:RNA polymerase sigma factor (sigma-70 family)
MTPRSLIEPARHAGTALLRSQTDARLVDLTRDGNERAFEAIVQRYRKPLLRYCARLLPPARAEDAVQQAFLSAHRAIHAGNAELNLRPWLYRIAHNASLNLLRQHGYDHDEVSEEIDGVETPPQAFERGERLRTVVAAVQDLPERQRDAIVLQALEGRSYEEIATELGVTDGAVRQLLNRARNTLREAAAALTPSGLLTRVAASAGDGSVTERIAGAVGSAGGGALLAKAGATLVVVGAVAGGAATGTLPGTGGHHRAAPGGASASAPSAPAAGGSRAAATLAGGGGGGTPGANGKFAAVRLGHSQGAGGGRQAGHGGSGSGSGRSGGGGSVGHSGRGGSGTSGHSGSNGGHGGGGSDSGGSGGGDGGSSHSGSGSSGSGSGDSSSGDSGSGSSSGSGSGDSGHSGSGDTGSGSSGSGDSGSGSSGSGSSGSGDSTTTITPTTPLTTTDSSGHDRSGSSGSGTSGSGKDSSEPPDDPSGN